MLNPGDIVTVDFPGVTGTKRRPAVVLSNDAYHQARPDVIIGLVSASAEARTPFDAPLQDWASAGLHRPSVFRSFIVTLPAPSATRVGRCSERDWQAILACVAAALIP